MSLKMHYPIHPPTHQRDAMLNVAKPKPHLFFPNFCFAHPSGEIKEKRHAWNAGVSVEKKKYTFAQPILLPPFPFLTSFSTSLD